MRRRALILGLAVVGVAGLAALVADDWPALRRGLIAVDALYLDETVWRLTHPASPPQPPADLPPPLARDWVGPGPVAVGHALAPDVDRGVAIDSLDALAGAAARGFTVLEVDLALTRDGDVLCYHEDDSDRHEPPQLSTSEIARLLGGRPLCRLEDLVAYARDHPDARFIIDLKSRFGPSYDRIREIIGTPDLGRQFIPQLYDFNELHRFRQERFFAEPIFTGYRSPLSNQEILDAARRFGVDVIVLHQDRAARLKPRPTDIGILVHPVNDPAVARRWLCTPGIIGIYTFSISPRRFPGLFAAHRDACRH